MCAYVLCTEKAYISPSILSEIWEDEIKKSSATEQKYKDIMQEHGVYGTFFI